VVSSAPTLVPSQVNCTPATPEVTCPVTTGSLAMAETVMIPETIWSSRGEVMDTVGSVVSGEGGGSVRVGTPTTL